MRIAYLEDLFRGFDNNILGHNVSFSRSAEEDLVERLDGIISVPQEWHKKKV